MEDRMKVTRRGLLKGLGAVVAGFTIAPSGLYVPEPRSLEVERLSERIEDATKPIRTYSWAQIRRPIVETPVVTASPVTWVWHLTAASASTAPAGFTWTLAR